MSIQTNFRAVDMLGTPKAAAKPAAKVTPKFVPKPVEVVAPVEEAIVDEAPVVGAPVFEDAPEAE